MSDVPLIAESFVQACDDHPDEIFCHVVDATSDDLKLSSKTWSQLVKDATNAAQRLQVTTGMTPRQPGDALVNISLRIRDSYDGFVVLLGIWLNRWTPVFISPRLSAEAVVELIRVCGSQYCFVDDNQADILSSVTPEIPSLQVLKVKDMVQSTADSVLPRISFWSKAEREVEVDKPQSYLHTSGSTGHPKLIPETHRTWWRRAQRLTRYPGRVCLSPLPLYHTAGLGCLIRSPFGADTAGLITETDKPYTGELLTRVLEHFPGSIAVIPPAILQEIALSGPSHVRTLAAAHRVMFVGAPLAPDFGNQLAEAGVKLMSAFGSTEVGQLTVSDIASDDPRDWQYVRFLDPNELYMIPEPSSDNLYRLIVKPGRFVDESLVNCYDPVGFSTGDLWQEHPTLPGLWKHMGRRGSVTVLSNGEKTDNIQLESLITRDPLIQHALVFGEGRFQNGVLVLPAAQSWDRDEILRAIWPTVENANAVIPQHSRLVKPLVIVADPQRRFVLSDKGTVRSQDTHKSYDAEIEAAYEAIEAGTLSPSIDLPEVNDLEGLKSYIRKTVRNVLQKDIADNADLFKLGMDSLMALTCRSNLLPLCNIVKKDSNLPRNIVYHCPSIDALYKYMTSDNHATLKDDTAHLHARLEEMMQGLSFDAPPRFVLNGNDTRNGNGNYNGNPSVDGNGHHNGNGIQNGNGAPNGTGHGTYIEPEEGLTVILTGSTGTFGSQLLTAMLRSSNIRLVHCLNRKISGISSLDRQKKHMDDSTLLCKYVEKVKFWDLDLTKEMLGLQSDALEEIRHDVTDIVHCAWDVNFNHPLDHFLETQIIGIRNLIDISLSTRRTKHPRIIFLSSVSAVSNYAGPDDAIPEVLFDDVSVSLNQGYAQAKYVAERILAKASKEAGVPVTIVRAGQLSGSTVSGAWNLNEHVPVLLQSCMALKTIPDTLPDVRWIPTDIAAEALLSILLHDAKQELSGVRVRHLDAPHALPGSTLVQCVIDASGGVIQPIPVKEWLRSVKDTPSTDVPATRLLPFYEEWLNADTDKQRRRPLDISNTKAIFDVSHRMSIEPELISRYFAYATSYGIKP